MTAGGRERHPRDSTGTVTSPCQVSIRPLRCGAVRGGAGRRARTRGSRSPVWTATGLLQDFGAPPLAGIPASLGLAHPAPVPYGSGSGRGVVAAGSERRAARAEPLGFGFPAGAVGAAFLVGGEEDRRVDAPAPHSATSGPEGSVRRGSRSSGCTVGGTGHDSDAMGRGPPDGHPGEPAQGVAILDSFRRGAKNYQGCSLNLQLR